MKKRRRKKKRSQQEKMAMRKILMQIKRRQVLRAVPKKRCLTQANSSGRLPTESQRTFLSCLETTRELTAIRKRSKQTLSTLQLTKKLL